MKKIILLSLLIVFGAEASYAEIVPLGKALKRAESFFDNADPKTKSSTKNSVSLVYTYPTLSTKVSTEAPLLFVFERESGGYVIVSGDDSAHPILGYSLSSPFPSTNIPDGMHYLLEWYASIIDYSRQKHWSSDSKTMSEWNDADCDGDNDEIVKLETAQWNQWSPYNDLCPIIDGSRCPSGCVATAIAIIMRYHKWPDQGKGHLDSYGFDWRGEEHYIEGYDLGHEYNWEDMPLSTPQGGFTDNQSKQIAQLLHDIGVMVQMQYTPAGSGAAIIDAIGLAKFFGYDKGIAYGGRGGYTSSEWESIIKKEIDQFRPVLYTGYSEIGHGHAFVIDGYCGHFCSINYGWGGDSRGLPGHDFDGDLGYFFTLTPIDGHEEDLLYYYKQQEMMYKIQPDTGSDYEITGRLGMSPCHLTWDFETGRQFDVNFSPEINLYDYDSFKSIDMSVWLFDKNSQPKEMISNIITCDKTGFHRSSTNNTINYYYPFLSIQCRINTRVEQGDKILLCFADKKGAWIPLMPMRRSDFIEFSSIPLSDLISIGYTKENPLPNDQSVSYVWDEHFKDKVPVFYIIGYKDIYWELRNDVLSYPLDTSCEHIYNHDCYIDDSDTSIMFFTLSPGNYQLLLRSIDEEVVIDFSL